MSSVQQIHSTSRRSAVTRAMVDGWAAWAIAALVWIGLFIAEPARAFASANVANVLTSACVLGVAALGQHIVILSGGIDLSVGSMASLAALLTAFMIDGYPIRTAPVVIGVLMIGALVGVVHGVLVARLDIQPFVVTLATFFILQGVAFLISTTPGGLVTSALTDLAIERVGPVPLLLVTLVIPAVIVGVLLRRTSWGRDLFAVGGDRAAARANGVRDSRTLVWAYVICSMCAALAGIVLASRATVGAPTAGSGLELSAITVVVVGGASLLGGRATLIGTLGGVLLLALVENSFTILQLPGTWNDLVLGAVILAAATIFVRKVR